MQILIAPDSFKECLTAKEAAEAMSRGWRNIRPDDSIILFPMSDGGEGMLTTLVDATDGQYVSHLVSDPLGNLVDAQYGILGDGETVVIEMARAAGLHLLSESNRNPLITSTFGVGQLAVHALDAGYQKFIIGLGGSATNDGGAGFAQALGYHLLDNTGQSLLPGGLALNSLSRIETHQRHPALDHAQFQVACDVQAPLYGIHGASHVFGPQKGATPEMVDALDNALQHYACILEVTFQCAFKNIPGAGAAGGLGAGLMAFTNATMAPGTALVAEACGLTTALPNANLVLVAEGRLDGQSIYGKTPVGIAALAQPHQVPVIALAGSLGDGYEHVYEHGIQAAFSIIPAPTTLVSAMNDAALNLERATENIARMINLNRI